MSWSDQQYQALSPDLRARVDSLVNHPMYDPWRGGDNVELLDELAGDLSTADYTAVKDVAQQRFRDAHGQRLDVEGERLAAKLIDHEALDPLSEWGDWESWVADHVEPGTDQRVVVRAARELGRLVDVKGLREMAIRELTDVVVQVLESLPGGVRDRLGFVSRNPQREDLIDPYLPEDLVGHRRAWVTRQVGYLEAERFSATREARYATAASILMVDHGVSKSATSRILGISTSIIDRIIRENPDRVTLEEDDPLIPMDSRLKPAS